MAQFVLTIFEYKNMRKNFEKKVLKTDIYDSKF